MMFLIFALLSHSNCVSDQPYGHMYNLKLDLVYTVAQYCMVCARLAMSRLHVPDLLNGKVVN